MALAAGLENALKQVRAVSITGETAAMRMAITTFCDENDPHQLVLTWTATAMGLGHVRKELHSSNIKPGMPIVGFYDESAGCNGYTKLIELAMRKWGRPKTMLKKPEAMEFMELLCLPSTNYSATITEAHGWLPDGSIKEADAKIVAVAHVTGGGVWGKFAEMLPKGIGADLDKMPEPPRILTWAQRISHEVGDEKLKPISDWDAHGDFHGGCRALSIMATHADAWRLIRGADKNGVKGFIVGETTRSRKSEVMICSRFVERRKLSSLMN
jgi:phosphoribosylaminoimidazole (AIR) synthetase